jgi:hypothetical protein
MWWGLNTSFKPEGLVPGLALGMDGLDGIMGCVISMPVPASHFPPHRSYFERSKIVFKVSQIAYKDFFIAASYI